MVRKLKKGEYYYYYYENGVPDYDVVDEFTSVWVDEHFLLHNESNKPAYIRYYNSTRRKKKVQNIQYRNHGLRDNIFGPADIFHNNSCLSPERYFINGKELTKKEWEEIAHIERNRLEILNQIT